MFNFNPRIGLLMFYLNDIALNAFRDQISCFIACIVFIYLLYYIVSIVIMCLKRHI